jgi:uncharacterized protein (DUF302 family)
MKKLIVVSLLSLFFMGAALADKAGLVTKKSNHSAEQTIDRLQKILKKKGIIIFARVSHTKGAKNVKIPLRKTELLIFGNPKLGSHFFTSKQTAGIDLPMKALAWEDEKGQVWLTYNDPSYIANRHGIKDRAPIVKKMTNALNNMTDAAVKKPAKK